MTTMMMMMMVLVVMVVVSVVSVCAYHQPPVTVPVLVPVVVSAVARPLFLSPSVCVSPHTRLRPHTMTTSLLQYLIHQCCNVVLQSLINIHLPTATLPFVSHDRLPVLPGRSTGTYQFIKLENLPPSSLDLNLIDSQCTKLCNKTCIVTIFETYIV